MKNIIITGGCGFLGSHLANYYHKQGHKVIVVDNLSRGKKENLDEGVDFYNWDLASSIRIDFLRLIENADYLFHLAATNGTDNFYKYPKKVLWNNTDSTMNLCNALGRCKNKPKVIYTSSSEVYGNPEHVPTREIDLKSSEVMEDRDTYAISKYISEYFIKQLENEYLILRIFNIVGKGDQKGHVIPDLIEKFKNNDFTVKGTGEETRSFLDVRDFVNIVDKVKDVKNDILNVGSPCEITIKQLVSYMLKNYFGNIDVEYTGKVKGDRQRRCPSVARLRQYIGDYEYISFDESLEWILNGKA